MKELLNLYYHNLKSQGVKRIACEFNTLSIHHKDKKIRTTFYRNNIDRTLYVFYNKSIYFGLDRKLADTLRQFISDNWLTLICLKAI